MGETENKETEMGRRAKKVTGFQGPRSQDRTGQTERGVYAKEGKKRKKRERRGALSDVVESSDRYRCVCICVYVCARTHKRYKRMLNANANNRGRSSGTRSRNRRRDEECADVGEQGESIGL